jgi:hypothetical protein
LRRTYPTLLQQPGYLLREFLDHNDMAQIVYGPTAPSDTYGILRLKVMSCVVAIVQHIHVIDNVDSVLSRSDIYYITHVGGVLRSARHTFSSDLFNIFDIDDVDTKLAQLINSRMLVLLCSPPRQPQKLTSGDRWVRNFNGKLPTAERIQHAVNTLVARINTVVVCPIPFSTLRPQFVQPSAHDAAMLEPASATDHIRHLAVEVKLCYTRQNAPVILPVTVVQPVTRASLPESNVPAVRSAAHATFNFPPPRQTSALFGNINVHYDAWSEYEEPTVYALREQQRIINWADVRGLTFSGDGLAYMQCLGLYHTSERPIVMGDNIVFLYCPQCVFTPAQPHHTLFSVTHVRYIVVHQRGSIYYFDRVDILYNFVEMFIQRNIFVIYTSH